MGKLYIVATPIGNIEDITLRAIRVLKSVDLILCENVRESHKLLKHYEIETATTNYYANSKLQKIDKIIAMLIEGKDIALISDAGTPAVSDPGSLLIHSIHEHNKNNFAKDNSNKSFIEIVSIPGASAVTALYSVSGVIGNSFAFYGFIPQKKGRQTFIKNILIKTKEENMPIIFYESVHRFEKLIDQLLLEIYSIDVKKNNTNQIENYIFTIGREMTKMHEQIIKGNISEIKEYFKNNQDKVRGEFVILIVYKKTKLK